MILSILLLKKNIFEFCALFKRTKISHGKEFGITNSPVDENQNQTITTVLIATLSNTTETFESKHRLLNNQGITPICHLLH